MFTPSGLQASAQVSDMRCVCEIHRRSRSIIRKKRQRSSAETKTKTVLTIVHIACLLKYLVQEGRSADIDLKGVATWIYKLSAAMNGGLAYIGNTK